MEESQRKMQSEIDAKVMVLEKFHSYIRRKYPDHFLHSDDGLSETRGQSVQGIFGVPEQGLDRQILESSIFGVWVFTMQG